MTTRKKPEGYNDDHAAYLNALRESAMINMFGAATPLAENFDLDRKTAREYLTYWMETFTPEGS